MVLLKEGTDTSQGKPQLLSNISACLAIAETLASTLGPRGMDKLIVNERGEAQITNDGATILKLLDIVHPAARTLVDIARAQDAEVGDGTTSVVLFAARLLKEVRGYIEEGVSPHIIMKGFRKASELVSTLQILSPIHSIHMPLLGYRTHQIRPNHRRQVKSRVRPTIVQPFSCVLTCAIGNSVPSFSNARPLPCRRSSSTQKSRSSPIWSSMPCSALTKKTSTKISLA